jgi:hypothetical protein
VPWLAEALLTVLLSGTHRIETKKGPGSRGLSKNEDLLVTACRHELSSCSGGAKRLTSMEFVQTFQLIVHGHQLVADVNRIVNPGKIVEHRLDLCLASDQDAALR